MKKAKKFLKIAVVISALWLLAALIDFGMVVNGNRPVFCIKSDSNYNGAGYSYIISPHPITGKSEFCLYIFGCPVTSNFTN